MNKNTSVAVFVLGALGVLLFFAALLVDVVFPETQFSIGSLVFAKRDSHFGIIQQIGAVAGFLIALGSFLLYRWLR